MEVWADGRVGYASPDEEVGGTALATEAVPEVEHIAADPQFEPRRIEREAFEARWHKRRE